jgi:hypothetical protein
MGILSQPLCACVDTIAASKKHLGNTPVGHSRKTRSRKNSWICKSRWRISEEKTSCTVFGPLRN